MNAAKILGRRLFARAAVGIPTALKFSGQQLGSALGSNVAQNRCGSPIPTDAAYSLRGKIWEALRAQSRPEQERLSVRHERRLMMGGLDPDLAVLNSMSLARRVQIQIDREIEIREKSKGLRAWLIKSMGGKPEDFE